MKKLREFGWGIPFSSNTAWWLSPTPLENMSSSVGMMKFPTEWKVMKHVPVTTNQLLLIHHY